jgi:hypothetical protein
VTDHTKIRKYRVDYNNNPPNSISFMSVIVSTSGRLHSVFVYPSLFTLETHREKHRKVTAFSELQEFNLNILPVTSSLNIDNTPIVGPRRAYDGLREPPRRDVEASLPRGGSPRRAVPSS